MNDCLLYHGIAIKIWKKTSNVPPIPVRSLSYNSLITGNLKDVLNKHQFLSLKNTHQLFLIIFFTPLMLSSQNQNQEHLEFHFCWPKVEDFRQ